MAANSSDDSDQKDLTLYTPLSLGTDAEGGLMEIVIPRNTSVPIKKYEKYVTTYDNQGSMGVEVYQGERRKCKDNEFLGNLVISEIPPASKGVSEVEICYEIDTKGILTVTSEIVSTGKTEKLTIDEYGRLSKEEIEKRVEDGEEDTYIKLKRIRFHGADLYLCCWNRWSQNIIRHDLHPSPKLDFIKQNEKM